MFRLAFAIATLGLANSALANCPANCALPSCLCPSLSPPGGISTANAPQFVSLTFDDSLNDGILQSVNSILNHKNSNGCPMRATFFIQNLYTNYSTVTQWYAQGHEVADHTYNHAQPSADGAGQEEIEITSNPLSITAYAGIPRSKIIGFRAPFLNYNANNFHTLAKEGLKYDSSMTASDPNFLDAFWPYTLDGGPANDCGNTPSICTDPSGVVPGLWEIPMHAIFDQNGQVHLMDPYIDASMDAAKTLDWLKKNFMRHYEGNRAPFGIYLHPVQFTDYPGLPSKQPIRDMLNQFFEWVREYDNVWLVNNEQMLSYMRSPVLASELGSQSYMKCMVRDDKTEICNGLDDDGDGVVDGGLLEYCSVGNFFTCYGCPQSVPTPQSPASKAPTSRCAVKDGCDLVMWDPIGCVCSTSALKDLGAANLADTSGKTNNMNSINGTSLATSQALSTRASSIVTAVTPVVGLVSLAFANKIFF